MENLILKVRMALRISTDEFDQEIQDLINSALLDLGIAGVYQKVTVDTVDALVETAVKTYCKIHFGKTSVEERDRLQKSYDQQKAQLQMSSGYTIYEQI